MKKLTSRWALIAYLLLLLVAVTYRYWPAKPKTLPGPPLTSVIFPSTSPSPIPTPIPTPTPTPFPFIDHYSPPTIPNNPSYTLIMVGDSMTEELGPNFDYLRRDLTVYYPKKVFGIFNYGFGSTNILSVEDRLEKDSVYQGQTYPAILNRYFDIFFLESMGNNPLSNYPLEQGLMVQTTALDKIVAELVGTHPQSLIVFMATIAPSPLYGKGVVDLSPTVRIQWANERRAYIENHINYAKRHNIPLINIYAKTLDKNGNTIPGYISVDNFIHPSAAGLMLISQMTADFLFKNKILLP